MPRRGENIHKRKDGRWEGRYIDYYKSDGKAHYKSVYGMTYAEVKAKLDKLKAVPKGQRQVTSLMTTEQLFLLWLDNKRVKLKESSYSTYYQVIHGHIIPYFKSNKPSYLTSDTVNQFVKDKLDHGRLDGKGGLSPKRVSDILAVLLQVIQYGKKKGAVADFDDDDINSPKIEAVELPVLTAEEQNNLLDYGKSDLDHKKLGVLIALYTGIRLGELCALQWKDINFSEGVLSITKTLQRIKDTDPNSVKKTKMVIDTPKSKKSIREIPLPTYLLCLLKQWEKEQPRANYVLSGKAKYVDPRVYQDNFKDYLKQAEVQEEYTIHSLRHTFATNAVARGFDIKNLSELLGHSSVRFTLEKYVHGSMDTKRASMERYAACY
ncbi:MAG: site-specific integrase [Oscillospiraceae bacterium]|nr:site-specific integrase [Oscillospiraceae bacterium]